MKEVTVAHACSACGDLELFSIPMKRVASVVCDKAVFPNVRFRPDIALLDRESNPLVVFEIVDTHPSTEEKMGFYRDSGVPVFEIGAALQYEQYTTPTEADIDSLGEPDASMYRAVRSFYQDPKGSGRASSYEPARRAPRWQDDA